MDKYKKIPNKIYNENNYIGELVDASYQEVKRLFFLTYRDRGGANRITADSHRRYFLPTVKIKNYNIEIDGRNFYNQPVNDLIKQYDGVRTEKYPQGKVMITQLVVYWILFFFSEKLQINCCWFKQTKTFRCRLKSNLADHFYW